MKGDTATIHVYGCSVIYLCKIWVHVFHFRTDRTEICANALFILKKQIDFVLKGNSTTSCMIYGLPAKLDSLRFSITSPAAWMMKADETPSDFIYWWDCCPTYLMFTDSWGISRLFLLLLSHWSMYFMHYWQNGLNKRMYQRVLKIAV